MRELSDFPHDAFRQQIQRLNETKPDSETAEAVLSEFGYCKVTEEDVDRMLAEIREVYPHFDPSKY